MQVRKIVKAVTIAAARLRTLLLEPRSSRARPTSPRLPATAPASWLYTVRAPGSNATGMPSWPGCVHQCAPGASSVPAKRLPSITQEAPAAKALAMSPE